MAFPMFIVLAMCFNAVIVCSSTVPQPVYISRNISTAEGDECHIEIESDKAEHVDIMRSTVNGKNPQTIYIDREIGLEIILPDEEQACYFRELNEVEKSEYAIEGNTRGLASDLEHMETKKVNATEEISCAYDIEESTDEKTNSLLRTVCLNRKITHLKLIECENVPQDRTATSAGQDPHSELRKKRGCMYFFCKKYITKCHVEPFWWGKRRVCKTTGQNCSFHICIG